MSGTLDPTAMDGFRPDLLTCPVCDVVHAIGEGPAVRTRCAGCGHVLTLGRDRAAARVVGFALTGAVLMFVVLFAPFLHLRAGSFESAATVVDVVFSLSEGLMAPLALSVMVFIVVLPLARALLAVYALGPLLVDRPNLPGARRALRLTFQLKPWAMAEIFMVGVGVALIKLAGMARVDAGAAFWAFALFVLVVALQDTHMCRNTLWLALTRNARS